MGAKSGCASCHAILRKMVWEVRAVSERARIELTGHLNKSRCALAAGIAPRWEWGWGRYPPCGCPWSFRSTRHAFLTRTLPCSDIESQLAEGKGGPTSTCTREEACECEITLQVCAPHSHPCSSHCAIEHACAPDLSPQIHQVVA